MWQVRLPSAMRSLQSCYPNSSVLPATDVRVARWSWHRPRRGSQGGRGGYRGRGAWVLSPEAGAEESAGTTCTGVEAAEGEGAVVVL